MLEVARQKNNMPQIEYQLITIEDANFVANSFDIVFSSLALHYIESFSSVCQKVYKTLVKGGDFVFSIEHPIFTAQGKQDWYYDENGKILHWPVDNYYYEGKRSTTFLGHKVIKYHRTMATLITTLLNCGFSLTNLVEATPSKELLQQHPEYKDELRRPMMLLIAAKK